MTKQEIKISALVEYDITAAQISELKEKYKPFDVVSASDDKLITSYITAAKQPRLAVEKRRKELKSQIIEAGKLVDSKAKELTDMIKDGIEQPLIDARQKYRDEQERIKQEAAKKEQERIDNIKLRLQEIADLTCNVGILDSSAITERINSLGYIEDSNFNYMEFTVDANKAISETKEYLKSSLEKRRAWEAEQQKAKEEADRLAKQQEELRKQQEEFDRRQKEAERIENEKRLAKEAEERRLREAEEQKERDRQAEIARQEAELQRQREELKRQQEESARKQREAEAELERKRIEHERELERQKNQKDARIRDAAPDLLYALQRLREVGDFKEFQDMYNDLAVKAINKALGE